MTAEHRLSPGKYRLQVADYELLVEAGVFSGHKTELIEGEVIVVSPKFRPHGMVKMRLYDALRDRLLAIASPCRPVVEFSLALSSSSMPDPDIMLTTEPEGPKAVPLASVTLIIEVADTSLADDLGKKSVLYGRAGVPGYWVADVNGRAIHQMWSPEPDGYARRATTPFSETITAVTIPGLTIATDLL